jgi:hypothetical protein
MMQGQRSCIIHFFFGLGGLPKLLGEIRREDEFNARNG